MSDFLCMTKAQTLLDCIRGERPSTVCGHVRPKVTAVVHRTFGRDQQAHSVTVPKKKAAGRAETRSTPEESPLAEPKSNGHVKSTVMEVTGMIRSVREILRRAAFLFGKMIYVHVALPEMAMQGIASLGFVRARYHVHHVRFWMRRLEVMRGSGARRLHEGTRWSTDMWQDFKEYP